MIYMQVQRQLQIRKQKGYEIAKQSKIVLSGQKWLVPSQSSSKKYEVILRLDKSVCTCPDFLERGIKCKHIFAVEIKLSKEVNADGSITITKKITYPQNWALYDKGQIEEKGRFMELLSDLVNSVEEPQGKATGRPLISISDLLFASTLKVYTQFSLRRFMSDLESAREKGYVNYTPCYASVGHFMERESLTPILKELIGLSALPLKSVETNFAVDSSGFRTTKFMEYCKIKHHTKAEHEWIKAHICCGVKTNIITAVDIGDEWSGDTNRLIPLVEDTRKGGFLINEVSADKAYSSRNNLNYIDSIGATPYIPFRVNATAKGLGSTIWRKMYHYVQLNRDEFLKHYHLRSNVESTFAMLKAKFSDLLRSKNRTAQVNELLLKILCHNIVVINNEVKVSAFS
jgi:transposase